MVLFLKTDVPVVSIVKMVGFNLPATHRQPTWYVVDADLLLQTQCQHDRGLSKIHGVSVKALIVRGFPARRISGYGFNPKRSDSMLNKCNLVGVAQQRFPPYNHHANRRLPAAVARNRLH